MGSIAIDGPAGAGKSTVARLVASRLGFIYIDTGAMYRAMALHVLSEGVDPADEKGVAKAVQSADISIVHEGGEQRVILCGEDVTGRIRTEAVSAAASVVSAVGAVREKLVSMQQAMARRESVVMDGRDIGTVVLPFAELKIFLTADAEVRAKRRFIELKERGEEADEARILQDIIQRDRQDATRAISPLKQAEDAVLVDSSDTDAKGVADRICALWEERCGRA